MSDGQVIIALVSNQASDLPGLVIRMSICLAPTTSERFQSDRLVSSFDSFDDR